VTTTDDRMCPFCAYAIGDAVPDGGLSFDGASVIAFQPLNPFVEGHTLIVPRVHTESFLTADPITTDGVAAVTRIMARRLGPAGVNVITSAGEAATQTVMHWHVHLIPRNPKDGLGRWPWAALLGAT
jgi:histidine triad (HIT) family protein